MPFIETICSLEAYELVRANLLLAPISNNLSVEDISPEHSRLSGTVEHEQPSIFRTENDAKGTLPVLTDELGKYHTLQLVREMMIYHPTLVENSSTIISSLQECWLLANGETKYCETDLLVDSAFIRIFHLKQHIFMLIFECLVIYCRRNKHDIQTLLSLVRMSKVSSSRDFPYMVDFFRKELPRSWGNENKKCIIRTFFPKLNDPYYPVEMKVKTLQIVISPILFEAFIRCKMDATQKNFVDEEMIEIIIHEGLGVFGDRADATHTQKEFLSTEKQESNQNSSCGDEAVDINHMIIRNMNKKISFKHHMNDNLKVELLKMITLIIEHLGTQLAHHRKDLIKFAWNHLKADDTTTKNWAYVNVCRFIAVYDTPSKIIIQVYVALLRTLPTDCKELVRIAIDTLLPALPQRLSAPDYVKAMKWTKKVLVEEGHAMPQLLHIWNVMIRHSTFYYSYRHLLVPSMVSSISKLGLMSSCPPEYRQISVGITNVILGWEMFRQRSRIDGDLSLLTNSAKDPTGIFAVNDKDDEYTLHPSMVQVVANFLIRLGLLAASDKDVIVSHLSSSCVRLFSNLVKLYPMVLIKLPHLEKLIFNITEAYNSQDKSNSSPPDPASSSSSSKLAFENAKNMSSNGSKGVASTKPSGILSENVILIVSKFLVTILDCCDGVSPFITQHLSLIVDFLPVWMHYDGSEVQLTFKEFILKIVTVFSTSNPDFVRINFHGRLRQLIEDRLISVVQNLNPQSQSGAQSVSIDMHTLKSFLVLIHTLSEHLPSWLDNHGSSLIQLSQSLLSDHLRQVSTAQRKGQQALLLSLQEHGQHFDYCKVYPTPHVGIVSDILLGSTTSTASPDHLISCLYFVFQILFRSLRNGCMEQYRHNILGIILSTLESSNSHLLLNVIVNNCLSWCIGPSSLLSSSEQSQILRKLGTYEKVKENYINPLQVKTSSIVESFLKSNARFQCRSNQSNMFSRLNISGLLSCYEPVRKQTRDRLKNDWGPAVVNCLIESMDSDCSALTSRYWISCIPGLLFSCADREMGLNFFAHHSTDENIDENYFCRIPVGSSYSHLLDRMYHLQSETNNFADFVDDLSLSYSYCAESALKQWTLATWNKLDEYLQQQLCKSILENTIRHKYCPSIPWPSYVHNKTHFRTFDDPRGDDTVAKDNVHNSLVPSNVPLGLVRIISSLNPLPTIHVEYLGAISQNYSTSFESIGLIKKYLMDCAEPNRNAEALAAMTQILKHDIEDDDMVLFIATSSARHSITQEAIAYELYGHYEEAQRAFYSAMETYNFQDENLDVSDTLNSELEIWEQRWVNTSRALSQWEMLFDYSRDSNLVTLNAEAALMLSKWDQVKELRMTPAIVAELERGVCKYKMIDVMMSIIDNKSADADNLCAQSVQMALIRWNRIPTIYPSSVAHKQLLAHFHQIIELRESASLINEVLNYDQDKPFDMCEFTKHWRQRLPNDWEDLNIWAPLLNWRNYLFESITKIHGGDSEFSQSAHESIWTTLKLTDIASKTKARSASEILLKSVSKGGHFENFDVCKQTLLNFSHSKRFAEGLNYFFGLSLKSLDNEQMADMMLLKSYLQHGLGLKEDACQSISNSIQCSGSFGKGWSAWGQFCLDMMDIRGEEADTSNFSNAAISSMICVPRAIECGNFEARLHIPRLLLMWTVQSLASVLTRELTPNILRIPASVWLPFIDFLLTRYDQLPFAEQIIQDIIRHRTQYACSVLARFTDCSGDDESIIMLRDGLKSHDWHLMSAYSDLSSSITLDLSPKIMERILHHLEWTFLDIVDNLGNGNDPELDGISFLHIQELIENSCDEDVMLLEDNSTIKKFVVDFKKDFLSNDCQGSSVQSLLEKLQKWIYGFRQQLNNRAAQHRLCSSLQDFVSRHGHDRRLEIPGFYNLSVYDSRPEFHPSICRFSPYFSYVRRNRSFCRRIKMVGDDGNLYHFYLSNKVSDRSVHESATGRIICLIDWALNDNSQSRKRDMIMHSPSSVIIGGVYDLNRDNVKSESLHDVYLAKCLELRTSDLKIILHFREIFMRLISDQNNKFTAEDAKTEIFQQACADGLSESVLKDFIDKSCSTAECQYVYKRCLSIQYGIVSALEFIVGTEFVMPWQIILCTSSAAINVLDIFSSSVIFRKFGKDIQRGPIPFRMTRNMQHSVPSEMLYGLTTLSLGCTLNACSKHLNVLRASMAVHLLSSPCHRDEDTSRFYRSCGIILDDVVKLAPDTAYNTARSDNDNFLRPLESRVDRGVSDLMEQSTDDKNNTSVSHFFSYYPML